jgi:hypothetical protein
MPNLSSSIVDAEALAFVTVYAFIYLMQDADPCMGDDHPRAFNIEDIPIPNPRIKLPVGGARAGHKPLRLLPRRAVVRRSSGV